MRRKSRRQRDREDRDEPRRKKFKYKRRSAESHGKRENQSSGNFDPMFSDKYQKWSVPEGESVIRILPPTFDDAENYGLDIFVHNEVGPQGGRYLSLSHHKSEQDPVEDMIRKLERHGDKYDEEIKKVRAKKRVLAWIIVRGKEKEGPLLWSMPWTVDKEIATRSKDRRSGKILHVDAPEDGYDVFIVRKGSGLRTEYSVDIDREDTPLSENDDEFEEWLDFVQENPLTDTLLFYDYAHIQNKLNGADPEAEDEDEEEEEEDNVRSRKASRRGRYGRSSDDEDEEEEEDEEDEDEDERPRRRKKSSRRRRDEEEEDEEEEDEEDEEEEDEEDEEEEDERPRRRRKSSRRSEPLDEIDEEEEDEEEEDEEYERPKKRPKGRSAGAKRSERGSRGRRR